MRIIFALLFTLVLLAGKGIADEPMTKVVFRLESPTILPASPGAEPRTLYRWQATKGRVEEGIDSEHKVQPLFIADGKDAWFINLITKSGRHMVDPSADETFYAPIIPPESPKAQVPIRNFEIGRELAFMNSQKIAPKPATKDGQALQLYECIQDGYTLDVYVSPTIGTPVESDVTKDGKPIVKVIYSEYSTTLPADPKLFAPPPNITISDN